MFKLLEIQIFLLIGLALVRYSVYGADCGNGHFGEGDPKSKDNDIETNTGFGYMMGEANYIVDCCGVVDRWEAFFDSISGSRTIYFQVWRPTTGNTYELVGQNTMTVSSNGEQDISIPVAQRITIKSGDRWGWWTAGTDMVAYKQGGNEEDNNYLMAISSQTIGNTVDWSSAAIVDERSYAMRMDYTNNDAPTFTNLPDTVSTACTTPISTSLFTVAVDDVNTYDVSSLAVTLETYTSTYSLDPSTYILTTAASLGSVSDVHLLRIEVADQCGHTATSTLTVSITNQPPTITSLTASNSTSEDTTSEVLLHTLVVTDPEGSAVTCSMAGSVPAAYPFTVKTISGTSSYGIFSDTNPGFDYDTQNQYDLTVECDDGEFTDTGTFIVYLLKNQPPVFINLQNSTSVSTTDTIGTNAFTVLVSDPENDDLTFSMTCDPTPCPFQIFDSGQIQISEDISAHTVVGYDLDITVSDGRNTVGPSILTITIAEINDPVALSNLPITKVVPENTAVGTSLYDVNYTDADTTQAHSFSWTSSPADGLTYFSLDSTTGEVSVATSPDFDTLAATTFVYTITVTDPITSDTGTMTIQVTNINEAPAFSQAGYTLSTTEGSTGDVIGTPSFDVTDPDVGDTQSYTLDCGIETGYFTLDSSSGQLSFQSNYDLDVGSLPTTVNCVVTVTDAGGLTDTATLTILIDYINDNTPTFSPAAYTFHVNYYAAGGTVVGTVTATDGDAGGDGVLTYTLDQTSLSQEYFAIDNTGQITTQGSLVGSALGYGLTVTISSMASDVGGLSDTATIIIAISDTTTTSTTTTTEHYLTFFEDSRNVAWIVPCIVLLIGCGILLGYIICTCHGNNGCNNFMKRCCNRHKKQHTSKKSKTWRSKRRDSYSFDQPRTTKQSSVRQPPPPARNQPWRTAVV